MIRNQPDQTRGDILIVDDNLNNLQVLRDMLSEHSYKVRAAPNGQTALMLANAKPPDLILLDIRMPEIDGYEVCKQLKNEEVTREIPVIFVSALDDVYDVVKGLQVGAVDYVTKPIRMEEVLARIKTHMTIRDLQRSLQYEIEERDKLIGELDAFAHTVAHDIANPISNVVLGLDLLQLNLTEREVLDEQSQDRINRIKKSGMQVTNIINELLLMAQIRKEDVATVPVMMTDVLEDVRIRLAHMIESSRVELIGPTEWPSAVGYAPWLSEVWSNYLSNGIKYGGKPPRLELGATPQSDQMIRFWVRDNGPGISPEAQERLFTEFMRLDQSRAKGYGLGLSIVKRIVNKLGGEAGVESELGQGSTFYFTLPAE